MRNSAEDTEEDIGEDFYERISMKDSIGRISAADRVKDLVRSNLIITPPGKSRKRHMPTWASPSFAVPLFPWSKIFVSLSLSLIATALVSKSSIDSRIAPDRLHSLLLAKHV